MKQIAAALREIKPQALYEKADREALSKSGIYPEIWDEPKEECIGYVVDNFKGLKKFKKRRKRTGRW